MKYSIEILNKERNLLITRETQLTKELLKRDSFTDLDKLRDLKIDIESKIKDVSKTISFLEHLLYK